MVDAFGRVFGHPGLHIADGSVMPGAVGANPSLTIAALADRFADAILDRPEPRPPARAAPPAPGDGAPRAAVALAFTEEMKGYVTLGEEDVERGFRTGKDAGTAFMFHLDIVATTSIASSPMPRTPRAPRAGSTRRSSAAGAP